MSRIHKAYEARFRALLRHAGARRLEPGVEWLLKKAQRLEGSEHIDPAEALTRVYDSLASRPYFRRRNPSAPGRFYCDAGLGGLARWLRAAGYEAFWQADIDDDVLLHEARRTGTTVLTTDSMLMERRVLRDGIIPAFWIPPTLTIPEQLTLVFREFDLTRREGRCMSCGGELRPADKELLRDRIPPKTFRWLNDFFVCSRCDKLFWHGTHWEKIQRELRHTTAAGDVGEHASKQACGRGKDENEAPEN